MGWGFVMEMKNCNGMEWEGEEMLWCNEKKKIKQDEIELSAKLIEIKR